MGVVFVMACMRCSGSTFAFYRLQTLLQLHGVDARPPLLPDGSRSKTTFLLENGPDALLPAYASTLASHQESMVILSHWPASLRAAATELNALNATVAHVYRANMLDQIVCAIRDCIDKADYGGFSLGYAVYDDGERVTDAGGGMCFDRRASDSRTTRAHIDVSRLVQALDARAAAQSAEVAYLRSSGLAWRPGWVPSVAYEDLAAYEYDARDAVGRSLDAWMRLLGPALGRSPNRTIVRDYLLSTGGGRTRAPHALSIYNYEAVEAALRGTRYAVLLRRTGNEPTVVDHVHRWWNVSAAAAGVRPSEPIAKAVLWSTLDDFRVRRYRRFENMTRRV